MKRTALTVGLLALCWSPVLAADRLAYTGTVRPAVATR
jgi:hypothetical protein